MTHGPLLYQVPNSFHTRAPSSMWVKLPRPTSECWCRAFCEDALALYIYMWFTLRISWGHMAGWSANEPNILDKHINSQPCLGGIRTICGQVVRSQFFDLRHYTPFLANLITHFFIFLMVPHILRVFDEITLHRFLYPLFCPIPVKSPFVSVSERNQTEMIFYYCS